MNANQAAAAGNARLQQIRNVSRAAKWLVLLFLAFMIGFMVLMTSQPLFALLRANGQKSQTHSFSDGFAVWRALVLFGYQLVLCAWYWKLSRLFNCYEQGKIFAAETISCIKVLGALFVLGGSLMAVWRSLPVPPTLPPPGGVTVVMSHKYAMGFFKFDFGTGIDFGLLLAGALIILIAWIMDEGRKIKEEQELTV
jgi:hypothetical protein